MIARDVAAVNYSDTTQSIDNFTMHLPASTIAFR